MLELSLQIEGQSGLTWARWKKLVAESEELGFTALFRSDHFTSPSPPNRDSLELIVSLTYAADHTQRIQFGALVAPLSFRDPIMLARQAAALDDLSNGRMILGLGAGWQEREHHQFGYTLGDITTRMNRLEEGLEVITRLLRSNEPISYEGQFYQLRDALLLPRPQRPAGPAILIGGNGTQRTLPLTARYADIWNAVFLSAEDFRQHSALLDTLLEKEGRAARSVKRTLFSQISLSQDPSVLIPQLQAYAEAGVEEIILWWNDFDDMAGLRKAARNVLPHLNFS